MRHDRGASPVGQISQLPGIEAWWVRALRLWCDGPDGQAALGQQVIDRMGVARAEAFMDRFQDLMSMVIQTARRPLLRHSLGCDCVGADEAVFALFCATAIQGEREDAMMIACLLLRADMAPLAVSLAQTLGLDLDRSAPPPGTRLN
ncbi:hypothetical protein [Pseudooceanicola atlanticus]|jgi:hypothetical protein|uniref:Uncharacterized protein n=1 Tax=Pseudooceanicola atlanticus TaxID=1461694 RepID=A0A0A0EGG9_9RHOB|nr:hypothetical protein [Pseudooceanicola atlanticus]KGM49213.1 hypothetical protein ATO9_11150 [Pseudooceanicola atlanticus]